MSRYPCARCDHTTDSDDHAATHALDTGHLRCIVCQRQSLTVHQAQTCPGCVARVREDLTVIRDGTLDLERRISEGAYSGGWLNPLVMVGDGAITGGGEDDHVRYRDPMAIVALLESWDQDWRDTFDHGTVPHLPLGHPSRQPGHVLRECAVYLEAWNARAAQEHPAYDGYAAELHTLRSMLEHVAALALHPVEAPIPCTCGGRLEQHFAPQTGLSDDRECRACGHRWSPQDYLWRYRMLTDTPGYVSIARAAAACERSEDTVWAWVRALDVPSACQRLTRRVVVELAAVLARSADTPRQTRKRAS